MSDLNNNISDFSTVDLIKELSKRDLFTNATCNKLILSDIDNLNNYKLIITKGIPNEQCQCRECHNFFNADVFPYYMARVDQFGFLWRQHALCPTCLKKDNKHRKKVFSESEIPTEPKKGDICTNCERPWNGRWHRHHVGNDFVGWECTMCNTSKHDQRNKSK
jgi:hypothetical protein